jgi:phosphatidylglycerol:prolipoprotein diacylglycerol transferase
MPLALGLAFGRIGWTLTGCCRGQVLGEGSRWAWLPRLDGEPPRFPATLLEAYFHALWAVILLVLAQRALLLGRHLALYLTAYAALRFVLETERENRPIVGSLTYYQLLSIALFALAAGTLVRRSVEAARARRGGGAITGPSE